MNAFFFGLGLILSIMVLAYLVYVMAKPEEF